MNIQQLIQMIYRGGDPQQMALSLISQSSLQGTPLGNNLLQLAQRGDQQGIENLARNVLSSQGRNFDTEFAQFCSTFGLR